MPQLKNVAINRVFSFSLQPLRISVFKKCTAIRIKSFLRARLVHFKPGNYGSFCKSWIAMIVYGICRSSLEFFRGTPGVHFIVIIVSSSQASFMVFYFIISYCVRRRWFFCPLVSVRQKIGKNFVMVCCSNSKIWLANNLTSPFPSYVSSLTGKNACFSPQTLV